MAARERKQSEGTGAQRGQVVELGSRAERSPSVQNLHAAPASQRPTEQRQHGGSESDCLGGDTARTQPTIPINHRLVDGEGLWNAQANISRAGIQSADQQTLLGMFKPPYRKVPAERRFECRPFLGCEPTGTVWCPVDTAKQQHLEKRVGFYSRFVKANPYFRLGCHPK